MLMIGDFVVAGQNFIKAFMVLLEITNRKPGYDIDGNIYRCVFFKEGAGDGKR